MMPRTALVALEQVDRVLAACGGGRIVVVGRDTAPLVRAWRGRGVDAGASVASIPPGPVDLIWLASALDGLADADAGTLMDDARRRSPRALVATVSGRREEWERRFLTRGWRKHPQYQELVDYTALDGEAGAMLLVEPVPASVTVGGALVDLAAARDLHMDMLRETGRRADAHVARYAFARRFVRPGDRVLDAACGLGYGSRLLADATLAESVLGLDVDAQAVGYATEHYAQSRSRLSFATRDLATLDDLAPGSFDLIVSFETVEHLEDPERFLSDCRRLLTPGGRFVCSVPNQWLDESGVDPNPHHLHVFDRARLEALCRRHFMLEHVYGQTAGAGMKLPDSGRALWNAAGRDDDAEWWLAVGITDPFGAAVDPVDTRWLPRVTAQTPTLISFARDYEHPWLVRTLVSIGLRSESAAVLDEVAGRTLAVASPESADRGAALCVRAYQQLSSSDGVTTETLDAIERYCRVPAANPHVDRWHISLRYVEGLAWLTACDRERAAEALESCANKDALAFSPLLATKTVGAAWLLGWMALQDHDLLLARRWWRCGVDHAERALRRPWDELMVDRDAPVLFGLREAALVVDLASQCAAGLHLLPHAADRPGLVWSQIAHSLAGERERQARATASLDHVARGLQTAADEVWRRCQAAETELARLRSERPGPWVFNGAAALPPDLRVAIFGTGQGGRRALSRLRARGAHVDCFADNDRSRWSQTLDEVPIIDPATLRSRGVGFIAVASVSGRDPIFRQLARLGYQAGRDYDAVA